MAADQFDGRVTAIRGAVVDLVFEDRPPPIDDAVEIVDSEEKINSFLPVLDEMMKGGLVTLEKVRVIDYRADPEVETPPEI